MKTLDCRGMSCPKPVILTKKEFENKALQELTVIVDNEAASINVTKLAESMGLNSSIEKNDGLYHLLLARNNGSTEPCCEIMDAVPGEIVVLVSTDVLGNGDDKLGAALMKSYMYAMTESETKPKTMLFLNGGAKLTCEGSDVLESIRVLESQGTEIMTCGTCLDFFGMKEKLCVGSVTNMYTIIEKMHDAANTIKL